MYLLFYLCILPTLFKSFLLHYIYSPRTENSFLCNVFASFYTFCFKIKTYQKMQYGKIYNLPKISCFIVVFSLSKKEKTLSDLFSTLKELPQTKEFLFQPCHHSSFCIIIRWLICPSMRYKVDYRCT